MRKVARRTPSLWDDALGRAFDNAGFGEEARMEIHLDQSDALQTRKEAEAPFIPRCASFHIRAIPSGRAFRTFCSEELVEVNDFGMQKVSLNRYF